MSTEQERARRLDLIGLSPTERAGLKDMVNEALDRHHAQWDKKSDDEQAAYLLDLARLLKECGLRRFQTGMEKAFTWIQYLPSAPEVRECLPPAPDVAKPRVAHDPNCADCSGSGWKYVKQAERRVTSCDCNTRPHRPYKVADAEDAAWTKQKVAELNALFRMGAARTPYQPKPAAPCKEEPAAIVAVKKVCSREIRELIPALVLTREQMDSRRAAERAEIVEAAKVG